MQMNRKDDMFEFDEDDDQCPICKNWEQQCTCPKIWSRKCDECNHIQRAQKPDPNKELTDSYRNSKCRSCKSMALDYGSYRKETEL